MKRLSFVLLALLISTQVFSSQKSENQPKLKPIALTPPMGWNSWNCFGTEVTEAQVKAVADYMAEHLKEYGWEYVVVDAGWYHPPTFKTPDWNTPMEPPQFMDEYGRLMPDTIKFPSAKNGAGFKPLADYVHSKGLKFGIHIMRGIPWNAIQEKTSILGTEFTADAVAEPNNICEWAKMMRGIKMTHPAGVAYYESIVELYEEWGVDYIKADDMSRPYRVDEVHALGTVLNNTERDIVLSLSPGAATIMAANDLRKYAHLWRISNDFWDTWHILKEMFDLCKLWEPYLAENNWPDADMLPVGKLRKNGVGEWEGSQHNATSAEVTNEYSRFTKDEQITMMNLWSMFRSPLMIGGYLPENNDFTLQLLTNVDLLEINQNSSNNELFFQDENESLWLADSKDGKYKYIALFNVSEEAQTLSFNLKDAGLQANKMYSAMDIWSKEVMQVEESIRVQLKKHASVIYRIKK